jgi:hypothetical protein
MVMKCPHCHSAATTRSSREISALVREVYYQCNNVVCGHTFKAMVEIVKTLSPPALADPAISAQLEARTPQAQQPEHRTAPIQPTDANRLHFARLEQDTQTAQRLEQARQLLRRT